MHFVGSNATEMRWRPVGGELRPRPAGGASLYSAPSEAQTL